MYNLLCAWDFNNFIFWLLQTDKNIKESQIADLQENIKSQQAETSKAKEELKGALTAMEQLKDGFKNERASWETEKAALLKRAEDAKEALKPVVEELTGLKHQVDAMTSAIFGKYFVSSTINDMVYTALVLIFSISFAWFINKLLKKISL